MSNWPDFAAHPCDSFKLWRAASCRARLAGAAAVVPLVIMRGPTAALRPLALGWVAALGTHLALTAALPPEPPRCRRSN